MGNFKWSFKSLNMGYNYITLLITPLMTAHEPYTLLESL